jgi:hypothetical protein
MDVLLID